MKENKQNSKKLESGFLGISMCVHT